MAGLAGGAWYIFVRQGEDETYLELQGNIDVARSTSPSRSTAAIETLAVDEGDTVKAGQVVATLDKRYFEDELRLARARRDNLAATLARLEHGSRPEEIAQARAQTGQQEATLAPGPGRSTAGQGAGQDAGGGQQGGPRPSTPRNWSSRPRRMSSTPTGAATGEIGPRRRTSTPPAPSSPQETAAVIQSSAGWPTATGRPERRHHPHPRSRDGAIVQAGETVFTLTLASPVWVRTYVNERDLGLVRPGHAGDGDHRHGPGRPYSGHIGFISPTAEFTPKTVETREIAHRPRLPPARGRGQPRRRPAPGHAGDRQTAFAPAAALDALAAPAWREAEAMSEEALIVADEPHQAVPAPRAPRPSTSECAHRPGRGHRPGRTRTAPARRRCCACSPACCCPATGG